MNIKITFLAMIVIAFIACISGCIDSNEVIEQSGDVVDKGEGLDTLVNKIEGADPKDPLKILEDQLEPEEIIQTMEPNLKECKDFVSSETIRSRLCLESDGTFKYSILVKTNGKWIVEHFTTGTCIEDDISILLIDGSGNELMSLWKLDTGDLYILDSENTKYDEKYLWTLPNAKLPGSPVGRYNCVTHCFNENRYIEIRSDGTFEWKATLLVTGKWTKEDNEKIILEGDSGNRYEWTQVDNKNLASHRGHRYRK